MNNFRLNRIKLNEVCLIALLIILAALNFGWIIWPALGFWLGAIHFFALFATLLSAIIFKVAESK